jgi:hypothetical protein
MLAVLDSCLSYSGIFAGFEGMIVSDYVKGGEKANSATEEVRVGFFILFLSLAGNIFVAVVSMLCAGAIRNGVGLGTGDYDWIKWAGRVSVMGCACSTFLYALAFQLYI